MALAQKCCVTVRCGQCRRQLDRLTVTFDSRYADPPGSDNKPVIYAHGRRGPDGTLGKFKGYGKMTDSLPHIKKSRTGDGPELVEHWTCNKCEVLYSRSSAELGLEFLRCGRAELDLELTP